MTTTSITRRVLTAVVIGAATVSVAACSTPAPTAATSTQQGNAGTALDVATAALVSSPSQADRDTGKKKDAARDRLARALHATWVTKGKKGVVTHQAIRGEVTAVSASSVTVKAADGFSATYSIGTSTKVTERDLSATTPAGRKAQASTVGALKVGARTLVVGTGATSPAATRIIFLVGERPARAPKAPKTPKTPKPQQSTASTPSPTATTPAPTATTATS